MTRSLLRKNLQFNLKPNSSTEKWYVFDIETNGLYDDVNEIFCIVIYDVTRNKTLTFRPIFLVFFICENTEIGYSFAQQLLINGFTEGLLTQ